MVSIRHDVGFEGIGLESASFKIDDNTITYDSTKAEGSAQAGRAVAIVSDKTVGLALDGVRVIGKLLNVDADNIATVQYEGGCALQGGTGATLTPGSKIVGALRAGVGGYIRSIAASGGAYAEAAADETQAGDHFICDASDADAVQVMLG